LIHRYAIAEAGRKKEADLQGSLPLEVTRRVEDPNLSIAAKTTGG
jgi:hypothetical protein